MRPLVHSYLYLRRAVGVIGLGLPVVLIVGNLLLGDGLLNSISGYYYSDLRDVYVGALCAMGVFLLSYRGYDRVDATVSTVAALAVIGTALLPTTPRDLPSPTDHVIGAVHIALAAVFFLCLAYFCLIQFRKTDQPQPTARKLARNRLYLVSGVVMLVSLALIVVFGWFLDAETGHLHPALWLESIATFAFGVAWLTKGEAILADLPQDPAQ